MSLKNKTLIFDVDDTMVEWRLGFADWLGSRKKLMSVPKQNINSYQFCYDIIDIHGKELFDGWVRQFNESEEFANLQFKDNMENAISELRQEGFKIVAVSSCGDSQKTHDMRMDNIGHLVDTLHCLPLLGTKEHALKMYKNEALLFMDDSKEHIEMSCNVGIRYSWLYENGVDINRWHVLTKTIKEIASYV